MYLAYSRNRAIELASLIEPDLLVSDVMMPDKNGIEVAAAVKSRSFEQGALHTADAQSMADIKSNKLSCLSSGCHDTVHNVKDLDHVKFWKPVQ